MGSEKAEVLGAELLGISGKTAFITGAASGIGFAAAELLLRCGMKVALADRNREALVAAEGVLSRLHPDMVAAFECNVCVRDEMDRAARACLEWSGGVDVLVTSAGIVRRDGADVYDAVFDVNVRGTLNTVEALRENFTVRRSGAIVTVGSIVASQGWPARVVYCASKGAVQAATRALALEFATCCVRVNSIAPGLCWTPMMREVVRGAEDQEAAFRFRALQQALGAMLRPEEVARHILFLASDLSSGIVGATLDASGGRLAGHVPDSSNPGPLFVGAWEAAKIELQ